MLASVHLIGCGSSYAARGRTLQILEQVDLRHNLGQLGARDIAEANLCRWMSHNREGRAVGTLLLDGAGLAGLPVQSPPDLCAAQSLLVCGAEQTHRSKGSFSQAFRELMACRRAETSSRRGKRMTDLERDSPARS